MYVHEYCVFISITPLISIIPASLQRVSTLFTLLCELCVFISITPHLSIIPASLQDVSTLFTLLCVCLNFYHTSSINNTCITTASKYSFYVVMCMYMNVVSSFLSHLIYLLNSRFLFFFFLRRWRNHEFSRFAYGLFPGVFGYFERTSS